MNKYTSKDYKGRYNLKEAERELIIEAHKKYGFNEGLMAKALRIDVEDMRKRIYLHGLYK